MISALGLALGLEAVLGSDEAILACAYEVLTVCGDESLAHEGGIFGLAVLQKRTLKLLFTRIARNVYLLAREGIDSRGKHNR